MCAAGTAFQIHRKVGYRKFQLKFSIVNFSAALPGTPVPSTAVDLMADAKYHGIKCNE
jgi:hypothetical protein